MKTEDVLLIGAVAAGAYFVYKATTPITDTLSDVGGGVGDVFQHTGSNYGKVADALGDALASDISLLDIKKDVVMVANAAKDIIARSKTTPQTAAYKAPSVAVTSSNTIYTSGSRTKGPVKTVNVSSASQMINRVYSNPAIKNIATTVGAGTIYTQKSVSLPPSLLSQVLLR